MLRTVLRHRIFVALVCAWLMAQTLYGSEIAADGTRRRPQSIRCPKRFALLAEARARMTVFTAEDDFFRRDVALALAILRGQEDIGLPRNQRPPWTGLLNAEEMTKLDAIHRKITALVPRVLGVELGSGCRERYLLDAMAEIGFRLAEPASKFYRAYNQHFIRYLEEKRLKEDPATLVVFSGRDSFPLLLAYRARAVRGGLPPFQYAPFNRLANYDLYSRSASVDLLRAELDAYYLGHRLAKKHLVVADFMTNGTVERKHRLILSPDAQPASLRHYLFHAEPMALYTPVDQAGRTKAGVTMEVDANFEVRGFVQDLMISDPSLRLIGEDRWRELMFALQELGAGLNESREDSIRSVRTYRGTHYKLASLQQMAAHYAFLQGLSFYLGREPENTGHPTQLPELAEFAALYLRVPEIFRRLAAVEDERYFDGASNSLFPLLRELQNRLVEEGLPPVAVAALPREASIRPVRIAP